MKHIIIIISIILLGYSTYAQDVPFKKANFPGQRKDLNEAKKQIKKGTRLAKKGIKYREQALYLLQSANTFNPDNAALNFQIGELLFNGVNPHSALPNLVKAYSLNPHISANIQFLLARSYHLNHQFDTAMFFYNGYASSLKPKEAKKILPQIEQYRSQVILADSLLRNPVQAFVDNLGDRINSSYPEYAPVMAPDGRKLWFTSRRPGSTGGKLDKDNAYFEDIYHLERMGGTWSDPINSGIFLNTEYHESSVAVSPDGNELFIRRGNPTGDLYVVRLDGRKPDKGRMLHKRISGKGDELWVTFSPDSTRVWFSSNRKGGLGGYDIWMCEVKKRGGWKRAVNAGPVINTPLNEISPTISSDGKTLSFSSDGLPGMGGYDIFYTMLANGEYSVPLNAGFPLNTASDDIHFSVDLSSGMGWLVSDRPGGFGHYDLYRVRLIDEERSVLPVMEAMQAISPRPAIEDIELMPAVVVDDPIILLQGQVTDQQTGLPLEANISLIDQATGKMIVSKNSGKDHGTYLMTIELGISCYINTIAQGYFPGSAPLDLSSVKPFEEYLVNIPLDPLGVDKGFELKRMTFRVNKAEFHTGADLDLDLLIDFMVLNPNLIIHIQGYSLEGEDTESLPGQRAAIVKQFLVRDGIANSRIRVDERSAANSAESVEVKEEPVYLPNMSGAIRVIVVSME